jgi:hypothetical protein
MTLMIGLHLFFFFSQKKCWPRFRVRNSKYEIVLRNSEIQLTKEKKQKKNSVISGYFNFNVQLFL